MNAKKIGFLILIIFAIVAMGCSTGSKTEISIVYGSEKEEWLEPLVARFNEEKHKTESGSTVTVESTPMGSIESVEAIIEERIQPVVWSPASSIYLPVGDSQWRQEHGDPLYSGNPKDLVLSPVVIAMWQPMAEALGWPEKQLGWGDIAQLAFSEEGWAEFGYPEWGSFKFGHTHPNFSNSGIVSIIAEAYAGADKQRDLTLEDLEDEELKSFMEAVESSIIHYGTSTGFFGRRMFNNGPSYLSAAVLYENLVIAQETKRLSGESAQLPVVAVYPKEGTFWSNHPYVILDAPWVTDEQKEAAAIFQDFLLAEEQQRTAMQYGFRPADPSIALSSPIDKQHGADPDQPKTVLEVPRAEVILGIQELWKEVKKPVDLVVVMDTSGSMFGAKISAARASLIDFINQLDDRDRLQVMLFNSDLIPLTDLSEVGPKRTEVANRVAGVIEGGDTRLYDAIDAAYLQLEEQGDPKHIRAIVVLSDGLDTHSQIGLSQLKNRLDAGETQGGNAIKLFTIAFGDDADTNLLKELAEMTGGKQYFSTPETIYQIYADIATFF
jgi:Ca-activated chloride channel family protein